MRIKQSGTAVYHVITRVVAGERLLDGRAKEVLRKMVWQVAGFSGVEILAYCVMSNHLHILVRVPEAGELDTSELVRRYALLYGEGYAGVFPDPANMAVILEGDSEEAMRWRGRLLARMNDLSAFVKTLKQRFSWWFNKTHQRFGTLWAERFKSVLVEDEPRTLSVVAAYIDLNPVRAGLVADPADYRWSSYGEAMGGEQLARLGLMNVVGAGKSAPLDADWEEAIAAYRMVLFGKGGQGRVGEQGAIAQERVMAVLAAGGTVPLEDLLRCRLRYLTDGTVFGSEEFVRAAGSALKFSSNARTKTLGRLPVADGDAPRSWRNPRVQPIG